MLLCIITCFLQSVNGHSIIEAVCQVPEDCAVCDGLLWGPSPQGVFCTSNFYWMIYVDKFCTASVPKLFSCQL